MQDSEAPAWAGPLQGVRVLDLSRVLAGPSASLALADLGAEVIKIEPPVTGDETRTFPPFRDGVSHYFLSVNRGKKSVVVDLKTAEGVAIVKQLASMSDILIENYRPGVMDRLGLGYEALAECNPGLIYCAISGFGMTGPLRDQPSFDIVVQALSGALSVNGEAGGAPVKLGIPLGDLVGGINGPIAILAALHERGRTGRGRLIDISLLDGLLGMLGYLAQLYFFTGEDPKPQGSEHPNLVPYGIFPARDGSIVIACLTNAFWARVCAALGMADALTDPRFETIEKRRDNREALVEKMSRITRSLTVAELEAVLSRHQVPHAPVLGIGEALAHPQAVARDMVITVRHAELGEIPLVGRPVKFPGAIQSPVSAPPALGQHTDEVLADLLDYADARIGALREGRVVA